MSLDRIRELMTQLPGHSLVYGGSHSGKLYQNYPWPPLDVLPAHRNDTQQRLEWLLSKLDADFEDLLDIGCANGAISLGIEIATSASVTGVTADAVECEIARCAADLLSRDIYFGHANLLALYNQHEHDIVLSLSVWKWIVRNQGLTEANKHIEMAMDRAMKALIFEPGLGDSGLDLGIGITKADIPGILREHTGCEPELLGIEPREDGTEREVWRCRR